MVSGHGLVALNGGGGRPARHDDHTMTARGPRSAESKPPDGLSGAAGLAVRSVGLRNIRLTPCLAVSAGNN